MAKAKKFLTAEWRRLAMVNYEIDPTVLSSRVPAGTELDSWDGRFLVSVVGFEFLRTRVFGIAIPFHCNFDEVNLRFYVRRRTDEGTRRGVVFVKELVPRAAIAWTARRFYNEDYVALPMRHDVRLPAIDSEESSSATYEWRLGQKWNRLTVDVAGPASLPSDESEETFITEHYWGYVSQRDGSTLEYQVEHPRWRVWRASRSELDCEVAALYGPEFVEVLSRRPTSAFVADGSAVTVRKGVRLAEFRTPSNQPLQLATEQFTEQFVAEYHGKPCLYPS